MPIERPILMLRLVRVGTLALALATAAGIACGGAEDESTVAGGPADGRGADAPEAAPAGAETAASSSPPTAPTPPTRPQRKERPLPAFSGWTLDQQRLSISSLIGKRLLIYFFDANHVGAPVVTHSVMSVSALRGKHNFEILGVSRSATREQAADFAGEHGIDFPVLDDSSGAIARRLGMKSPMALVGVDAEGYVTFGVLQFPTDEHASELVEDQIRRHLRLPTHRSGAEPVLGSRPAAPLFTAQVLDGDAPFELAAHRGTPIVLIFFLHTCSHCHETLEFMKETLASLPEGKRPLLIGLEVTGRTAAVRAELKRLELDFFPVLFDDDGSIRASYGSFAGVPDTFLIDPEGRILERVQGWRAREDPPLMRMRLAKMAGAPVPMLLRSRGYSGSDACGICHEREHETWQFTSHATAYDTLVRHGEASNPECVGCHVVGYQKTGGFVNSLETADLENVGCESCHGRGGPHLSPGFVPTGEFGAACMTCHDPKHSLGFEYDSFLPRVSHAALDYVTELSLERKQMLLAEWGAIHKNLLPSQIAHVGSEACKSCHEAEYATWSASPHARAGRRLDQATQKRDTDCLRCHTTGFGRDGGFPDGAAIADHTDLGRVGCESCHGPGGEHVSDGARRIGSIVSLGDKCDSCVILQICGSCHDDANDPGFEFAVQAKIDAQRHGTIEAGTGRPKGTTTQRGRIPAPSSEQMLEDAFALLDRRG